MTKNLLIIFLFIGLVTVGSGYYFMSLGQTTIQSAQNKTATTNTTQTQQTNTVSQNTSPINTKVSNVKSYTLADIQKHNSAGDCWMAISGNVYNVTSYIASGQHNPDIIAGCGLDATSMFDSIRKHSGGKAQSLLPGFEIGILS